MALLPISEWAGIAFIDAEGSAMGVSSSCSSTVPAGQVGLGCSYAFNKNISVDIGYSFVIMRNVDASNYMHQAIIDLQITF